MKRLACVILMVLPAACGSSSGGGKDAGLDVPADLPTGAEAAPVDANREPFDARADNVAGRDVVGNEVSAIDTRTIDVALPDAPLPPFDAPDADAPMVIDTTGIDTTVVDGPRSEQPWTTDGLVGERPAPADGAAAACQDRQLSYLPGVIQILTFSPDSRWLAGTVSDRPMWWDLGRGLLDAGGGKPYGSGAAGGTCSGNAEVTCHLGGMSANSYLPDGRLAGGFCGGQFLIFGCESMPLFFGPFAVSPVGNLVAEQSTPIQLWDTFTNQRIRTLASGGASSLVFSPDGAILIGGIEGVGLRLWNVASGEELMNLPLAVPVTADTFVRVGVSPDGRWMAALYAGTLQIWSLRTYAVAATFAVDALAQDFAFARDGNTVITGGARVNVYSVTDGSLLRQIGGRTYIVEVSPDGTMLAASGEENLPVQLYCLQ
jgi:WD40 repeat protein